MRFLLVDRVDAIVPGRSVTGVKNVTLSDDVLQDHFPDYPLFPGTLVIEALAQLGGFLIECSTPVQSGAQRRAVLAQVDKAKFHRPCFPGDQLILNCTLSSTIEGAAQVEAEATVTGERATRATLTFVLRAVESAHVHEARRALYRTWTRSLSLDFPLP